MLVGPSGAAETEISMIAIPALRSVDI